MKRRSTATIAGEHARPNPIPKDKIEKYGDVKILKPSSNKADKILIVKVYVLKL